MALALAGLGSVLSWRARRRWKSAIEVIAVDLLNSLIRDTGAVMSGAGGILLDDEVTIRQLDYAFQLPWTETSADRVDANVANLVREGAKLVDDDAETALLKQRLRDKAGDLRASSDRLRETATALDSYARGDHVMPLLAAIGLLHRRVQRLCDLATDPEPQPGHVVAAAAKVLGTGLSVASAIHEPASQIGGEIKDPDLLAEFDDAELALTVTQSVDRYVEQADRTNDAAERLEALIASVNQRTEETRKKAEALSGNQSPGER